MNSNVFIFLRYCNKIVTVNSVVSALTPIPTLCCVVTGHKANRAKNFSSSVGEMMMPQSVSVHSHGSPLKDQLTPYTQTSHLKLLQRWSSFASTLMSGQWTPAGFSLLGFGRRQSTPSSLRKGCIQGEKAKQMQKSKQKLIQRVKKVRWKWLDVKKRNELLAYIWISLCVICVHGCVYESVGVLFPGVSLTVATATPTGHRIRLHQVLAGFNRYNPTPSLPVRCVIESSDMAGQRLTPLPLHS